MKPCRRGRSKKLCAKQKLGTSSSSRAEALLATGAGMDGESSTYAALPLSRLEPLRPAVSDTCIRRLEVS